MQRQLPGTPQSDFRSADPVKPRGPLPEFQIAFQPIVNVATQSIVAYEALVRGAQGQSFHEVTHGMDEATMRLFHRAAAAEAIRRAVNLGIPKMRAWLSLNILPDLHPDALNAEFVRDTALAHGLPIKKVVLELTEDHLLTLSQVSQLLLRHKACGFVSAMDDFGAGYAGLSALVECCPEMLKLDRAIISGIDGSEVRQKIVWAFVQICKSLHLSLIAEGVETDAECDMLRRLGVENMQGYLFCRPVINRLPKLRDCGLSRLAWRDPRQQPRIVSASRASNRSGQRLISLQPETA